MAAHEVVESPFWATNRRSMVLGYRTVDFGLLKDLLDRRWSWREEQKSRGALSDFQDE